MTAITKDTVLDTLEFDPRKDPFEKRPFTPTVGWKMNRYGHLIYIFGIDPTLTENDYPVVGASAHDDCRRSYTTNGKFVKFKTSQDDLTHNLHPAPKPKVHDFFIDVVRDHYHGITYAGSDQDAGKKELLATRKLRYTEGGKIEDITEGENND